MGVTMFVQMRMTPAGTDPQQQKMMAVMMPIMFTGFQIFLPSGLALYVLTNYLLGIVHQVIINRLEKRYQAAPVAKASR
jgi:YidC/Oxa1 family membrane protein insertase